MAALEDRTDAAAERYAAAIEGWRSLDARSISRCASWTWSPPRPRPPGADAAKEARDIFTQLRAQPFLERLNRATGTEETPG